MTKKNVALCLSAFKQKQGKYTKLNTMNNFISHSFLIISILFLFQTTSNGQLTVTVNPAPENTPSGDDIYIVGSFNNWNPTDNNYKLTNTGNNTYQISFSPAVGTLEFKFTRGSWTSVEGDANGQEIANRTYAYTGGQQSITLEILTWKDIGSGNTTAAENVEIISTEFNMPQLNRTRRVWIYLPPNYNSTSNSYPVMYMQDAQNIFDAYTSFSGEWEVDEALNTLFAQGDLGAIVVGIDNGGGNRINEYSPWVNASYGGGQGDAYATFLVETLKPYIDSNYRTKQGRENTGIMGSSMGGLISFYTAIEHQDIFSKVGVFSPSFWFSNEVYNHVQSTGKQADMCFYFLAGEQESATMVSNIESMITTLDNAGFQPNEHTFLTHADGQHSEWYWRREFPAAYQWLFSSCSLNGVPQIKPANYTISPNPFPGKGTLKNAAHLNNANLEIYDTVGKLQYSNRISAQGEINLEHLKTGFYFFHIIENNQLVSVQKIQITNK